MKSGSFLAQLALSMAADNDWPAAKPFIPAAISPPSAVLTQNGPIPVKPSVLQRSNRTASEEPARH
jgi:hypothetical protein